MKIKNFTILQSGRPETVSKEANQLMNNGEGWQPFGSPVIDHNRILQAMVIYEQPAIALDLNELHSVLIEADSYIARYALRGSSEILGKIGEQLMKISIAAK